MKLGRTMIGYPIRPATTIASSRWYANPDSGVARPISVIARWNSSRFSAVLMAVGLAPIISTP